MEDVTKDGDVAEEAELVLADDADVDRYAGPIRILLIENDPRAAFVTAEMLRAALAANDFNQRRTAQALGLGYHQLRRYLRKHAIVPHPRLADARVSALDED